MGHLLKHSISYIIQVIKNLFIILRKTNYLKQNFSATRIIVKVK
jgi:hypothetical protein